jgi:hypothetical protein
MSADRWPDHVRLADLEPYFICEWAKKPRESMLMIDGDIHYPVLSPEDRRDRAKVNEALRDAQKSKD